MADDKKKSKLSVPNDKDLGAENNKSNANKPNVFDQTKARTTDDTAKDRPTASKLSNKPTPQQADSTSTKADESPISSSKLPDSKKESADLNQNTNDTNQKKHFLSRLFTFKKASSNSSQNTNKTDKAAHKKIDPKKKVKKPEQLKEKPKLEDSIKPNDPCYTDSRAFEVMKELIKEQRSQRRWRLFRNYSIAFVIISLLFSSLFTVNEKLNEAKAIYENPTAFYKSNFIKHEHIAVISLKGIIIDNGGTNAMQMHKLLQKAFANPAAKTIFIDANSPGGSPVQSALIFDAISRLKKQYSKPIYAIVSDICASGCYYAIAGVDKIFVNASSILGSIGVRLESFDLQGLLEKAGAKQRLLTAGENKAILNPFGEFPDHQREYLQNLIDKTHIEFVDVVIEGRGKKIDANNSKLFSGLIWNGRDSIKLGLADSLGDLVSVSKILGTETLEFYSPYQGFLKEILEAVSRFRFSTQQHLKATFD